MAINVTEHDAVDAFMNDNNLSEIPNRATTVATESGTVIIPEGTGLVPPPIDAEETPVESNYPTFVPVSQRETVITEGVRTFQEENLLSDEDVQEMLDSLNIRTQEPNPEVTAAAATDAEEESDQVTLLRQALEEDDIEEITEEDEIDPSESEEFPEEEEVQPSVINETPRIIASVTAIARAPMDEDDLVADMARSVIDGDDAMSQALDAIAESNSMMPAEQNRNLTAEDVITMIEKNTEEHTIDESTLRFSDAAWFKTVQQSTVIVAGQGGIGSWVTMLLSRVKPAQIFIYDDDSVEAVNLAGQLYSRENIGLKKVNAMADVVDKFSNYHGVFAINEKWRDTTSPGDIMICGFDNMEARRTFFRSWVDHVSHCTHPEKCLFIDGRLTADDFQIFAFAGDDTFNIRKYNRQYLFDDFEAEHTVCSYKQTSFCAALIGGTIVNIYTNFMANTISPVATHTVPFRTYYDSNFMILKVDM